MTIAEKAGRMSAFFFAKLWSLLSIFEKFTDGSLSGAVQPGRFYLKKVQVEDC